MRDDIRGFAAVGVILLVVIVAFAGLAVYWVLSQEPEPDCSWVTDSLEYTLAQSGSGQTWFNTDQGRYIRNWFDGPDWQYESPKNAYIYGSGGKTNAEVFVAFRDRVLHYEPVSRGFTSDDLDWFYCACKVVKEDMGL